MNSGIIGCRTMTSVSSMVGNLTSIATEFVKNMFPNGFIKNVYISETFNPVVMDKNCDNNYKHKSQTLFIQPVWNANDMHMELPHWHKSNEFIFSNRRRNYNIVFEDFDRGTFIYSIPNRLHVRFNCKIRLQTPIQALDVCAYVNNYIDPNGYRYLNDARLSTEVPISIINAIAIKEGYDITNEEDRRKLQNYLIKHSLGNVTQGINLSTGNISYQYGYNTNILIHYGDEVTKEHSPSQLSVGSSYVDFDFSMECTIPQNYIFETKGMTAEEVSPVLNDGVFSDGSMRYVIYLDTDFIKEFKDGKTLIEKQQYFPDINVEYDELCIEEILDDGLRRVINQLNKDGYIVDNVVHIEVGCGRNLLEPEMYSIDWDTFTLKTKYPMSNTTYTVLVYAALDKVYMIDHQIESGAEHIHDIEI